MSSQEFSITACHSHLRTIAGPSDAVNAASIYFFHRMQPLKYSNIILLIINKYNPYVMRKNIKKNKLFGSKLI